jgi:uncharacterized protein
MRIVVDINHPAHVHYFKNFIRIMKERGHEVLVTASEKDVALQLLYIYKIEYINLGQYGKTFGKKLLSVPLMDLKMLMAVRNFNPDIFLGFGSIRAAHVAFLLGKPCINFTDTEHSKEQMILYKPVVTKIYTPDCFLLDLGPKQIRFKGYMELAALHPNYFTPNPDILKEISIAEGEPFIIVRFVSWQASHDVGQHGILDKVRLVKELEQYGRVLITSEGAIPPELISHQVKVSPEKMHDLLSYASLYIGEGGTMASEAAMLGTPSILVSSLVGTMGNFIELEETYGLLYSFKDGVKALNKAKMILGNTNCKDEWQGKRERLLNDKIDLTIFMVRFIENYPKSHSERKG